MNSIDLSSLYRSSVGYDRLASLLNNALSSDSVSSGYPPYNIEMLADNRYAITLAVAGFVDQELDIKVDSNVLTVRGEKKSDKDKTYLHQGIAYRTFERKFNLADYVEVTDAELNNGLLTIRLVREIPEAMKPRSIPISQDRQTIEHSTEPMLENSDKAA